MARSRGAAARQHGQHARRCTYTAFCRPRCLNELRDAVRASRSAGALARSELRWAVRRRNRADRRWRSSASPASAGSGFTPQPRGNHRYQVVRLDEPYQGRHSVEGRARLQLHQAHGPGAAARISAAATSFARAAARFPVSCRCRSPASRRSRSDCPPHTSRVTAIRRRDLRRSRISSLFAAGRVARRPTLTLSSASGTRGSSGRRRPTRRPASGAVRAFPSDNNNIAPRLAVGVDPRATGGPSLHGAYGVFYDNILLGRRGSAGSSTARMACARWCARDPARSALGLRRDTGSTKRRRAAAGSSYPSVAISIDPGLRTTSCAADRGRTELRPRRTLGRGSSMTCISQGRTQSARHD